MTDIGHEWTDEQIERLSVKMHETYAQAANEMQDKLEAWLKDYESQNMAWQKAVKTGVRTQGEYDAWLADRAMERQWQQDMVQSLSMDALDCERLTQDLINDEVPNVYRENANWAAYDIDAKIGYDTRFTLYDIDTVRRLIAQEPQLIPGTGLDEAKSFAWNNRKFSSAITQGILQGESIPNIANRLKSVIDMDERSRVMAARTACTSAENAGRIQSYKRAESMGIKLKQEWIATLDGRTRDTHRLLDGQKQPVGGVFCPEGYGEKYNIRFPGDPRALPSMVWSCRCTLVAAVDDVPQDAAERWSKLPKDVSYDDWKSGMYHTYADGTETEESKRARRTAAAKSAIPSHAPNLKNVTGKKPNPWDEELETFYLPDGTRSRLGYFESLKSYDDFERHFADIGIELTTDLDILSGERRNDDIKAVREQCQKIAVAIDAYQDAFGQNALSKLKRIHLYDDELPNEAAYHFNMIGENDPLAGTIRFRQWDASGKTVFHELAHAFQDSQARAGEDAVTFSERMTEQAHLDKGFTAYAGASKDAYEAERFADAFGYGFAKGRPEGLDFIRNVWRELFNESNGVK